MSYCRPPSPSTQAWSSAPSCRAQSPLTILVVVLVLLGIGIGGWSGFSAWQAHDEARYVMRREWRAVNTRHQQLLEEYRLAADAQQRIAADIEREIAEESTRAQPDPRQLAILYEHREQNEAKQAALRERYHAPLQAIEEEREGLAQQLQAMGVDAP